MTKHMDSSRYMPQIETSVEKVLASHRRMLREAHGRERELRAALEAIHNMAMNSCVACCSSEEQSYAAKILKITMLLFEQRSRESDNGE